MNKLLGRLAATGLLAAAAPLGLLGGTAHAATLNHQPSAIRPQCILDGDGDCVASVAGQSLASPALNVRSGPGTGYGTIGSLPYLQWGRAFCYSSGTVIGGDPYWDYGYYNGTWGYVADWLLYTAGDITVQLDPC
jgi:hypothetical protein